MCSSASSAGADGNDWAVGWVVFEKVPPNLDASNVEAGDQVIFRQQAMGAMAGPGVRVMIHSNSPGAEFVAYQPRGAGGIVGGFQTFAIDYGTVLTPLSADRAIRNDRADERGPLYSSHLALGAMRVARTAAGVCL